MNAAVHRETAKQALHGQIQWDTEFLAEALEYAGYDFPPEILPHITQILAIPIPQHYLTKDQIVILAFQEMLLKVLDEWIEFSIDGDAS